METIRVDAVDRVAETRVGKAAVVRDIFVDDQLWGHVLEISEPVTRYLLVTSVTDLFDVNFSLKTAGDIAQVIDYARDLILNSGSEDRTRRSTAEPKRWMQPVSGQLGNVRRGRRRLAAWETLLLIAGLTIMEAMLYFDLHALKSGRAESIRVWAPIKTMYEAAGFWGAISVLPVVGVLVLFGFRPIAPAIPSKLGRALSILMTGMACLAFWGIAVWITLLPALEHQRFEPITLVAAGLLALLGTGLGLLMRQTVRLSPEQLLDPQPTRIDVLVEQHTWLKAAMVIAIVLIIGAVCGLAIYLILN